MPIKILAGAAALVLFFTTAAIAQPEGETSPPVEVAALGEWLGVLSLGQIDLRLALSVERGDDGSLTGVVDSLDQGVEIPVGAVAFTDGALGLELPAIGAGYAGELSADGDAFDGTWTQGGRSWPLRFERQEAKVALIRPQEPKPPFPYAARDVTFRNDSADIRLAGTYVVPEGDGPFPAVLFVSGSGPQDRDEQLMGHKPFLVLADHLARHGIASLRFDDRGYADSEGDHMGSTVDDFATDVEAGLAYLLAQPEVDRNGVGILGHSEGGVTGPKVAAGNDEVDFLVLLAPPGVPLDELLARQSADVLRLAGVDEELIERAVRDQVSDLELVQDDSLDAEALAAALRARVGARRNGYSDEELEALGFDPADLEQAIRVSTTAWFRSVVRAEPASYLSKVDVPVLAVFGEKDIQVAAEENAAGIRDGLAGNGDVTVRVLPELNHLLQHADTGGVDEYGKIEETMAPDVLDLVASWIGERFAGVSE